MNEFTISTAEALIAPQIAAGKPQAGASPAVMKAPDSRERPAHILEVNA